MKRLVYVSLNTHCIFSRCTLGGENVEFLLRKVEHAFVQISFLKCINVFAGDDWSTAEPQIKVRHRGCPCVSRVCICMALLVWEHPGLTELLGCIGILRRDWQGRSLLGEIVNRVEPVISSRQPWKGDGPFTRKLLRILKVLSDWFGPGPTLIQQVGLVRESTLINSLCHSEYSGVTLL